MNYGKQEKYLRRSRIWTMVAVVIVLVVSWMCLHAAAAAISRSTLIVFVLVVAALSASLLYTPDYLQLTVNPEKRWRWQVKIRWRIIAAVLVLGMIMPSGNHDRSIAVTSAVCLALVNLAAAKLVRGRYFALYFLLTDFLIVSTFSDSHSGFLLPVLWLAAMFHLFIVSYDRRPWLGMGILVPFIYLLASFRPPNESRSLHYSAAALVAVVALGSFLLVARAQTQHRQNLDAAMRELREFTSYSEWRVRRLWSTSNQELAKNWEAAAIPENDSERITQWYRDNSELYMFAISAYNLEYKRIISNLKVLRYAKGACLDYGAGNGELVLEMARNGHPAAYYDVDGVSKKFAQYRAEQQVLDVKFASSKEDLQKIVQERRLDTIFSFDVLEHLPDLAGELSFLSSLLNPGGLMMFDLPAGSTKAHPMHLNHNLDFRAHLRSRGMEEKRNLLQKLPFWKQEKYVFIRQAEANQETQGLSGSPLRGEPSR
ncbi:MAG: hypothetical protein DMG65_22335 [Candidatus Angelobacter sp. Gp1-AA117]|nr:MAG: hypothetical protein DMG65_22335 [Candidatus Angelobacter sp. Gp1-AA117]